MKSNGIKNWCTSIFNILWKCLLRKLTIGNRWITVVYQFILIILSLYISLYAHLKYRTDFQNHSNLTASPFSLQLLYQWNLNFSLNRLLCFYINRSSISMGWAIQSLKAVIRLPCPSVSLFPSRRGKQLYQFKQGNGEFLKFLQVLCSFSLD